MSLLIRGCQIIDATTPDLRQDGYVLVDGEIIKEVGSGSPPAADQTLDLGGTYLLPGLWDVHTHLRPTTWTGWAVQEDPVESILNSGRCAMDALQAGVTSLRVVGIRNWADVAWREAFDSGQCVGPRLFCCGDGLRTTAGHGTVTTSGTSLSSGLLDGPDAFVKAVRNQIKHGVNQIKLITTGGIMGSGHDVMSAVMFLKEELEAAIRIAKQRGVPVAVHATSEEAVKWAVQTGAHSIEHGYILDKDSVSLMARHGTYYVPTLALSHLTADQANTPFEKAYCEEHRLPDEFRERANHFAPIHEESFHMAVDGGVKIASGSDQGPPKDAALLEIEALARCGLGARGAIVAATLTAAEVCKAQDILGTVEPGKLADLIAVTDNPLENIHNLRRLIMVMKGGKVVVDNR